VDRASTDRSERGAALVEMALVAPLLLLLLFGIVEFGFVFKDRLTISHATNAAARTGSTTGTDPAADFLILGAVEAGLTGAVDLATIDHVDIYKANPDGSKSGSYNRYFVDASSACGWNPCPDPSTGSPVYGNPSNWGDPSNRDVVLDADGLDTLGIEVQYTHTWLTGILGFGPATWVEQAEVRLEPDVFGP